MYPQQFELLDKKGRVVGRGLRPRKHARLGYTMTFAGFCAWVAGGRRKRLLTTTEPNYAEFHAKNTE